jgi:DMSO reductase family type II enzyme heme b subunit
MQAKKVTATQPTLLDPAAAQWSSAERVTLALMPTPLASQPSAYIRAVWKDKPYGKTRSVRVSALNNGGEIFFRLEWEDPQKNDTVTDTAFADAAALLFPMGSDAPLLTMGDTQHPVNAWHWRADLGEQGRNNVAHGLGSTVLSDKSHIVCRASWDKGVWRLVISRPLSVPDQADQAVQLKPGQQIRFAVAIWQGQNGERAGIKAFSQTWRPLTIEA